MCIHLVCLRGILFDLKIFRSSIWHILSIFLSDIHFEWKMKIPLFGEMHFVLYWIFQDDTYTDSYISTIGVDFVSIGVCCRHVMISVYISLAL